jgi:opacity protein-like surface antigen
MKTRTVVTWSIAYRTMLWLFLAIIALQAPAHAQDPDSERAPVSVGINYHQMVPRGEFRENTRGAPFAYQGALGIDLIFHVKSVVNLRLDYLFGTYDKNPCKWCEKYGFRAGGVAAELVLPRGPVRPYATAGVGRVSFSSFDDSDGTKADTGAGYVMYGVGAKIPIRPGLSADLAGRYHDAGPVSYQHVLRNPDGSVTIASARTHTAFVMYTAGLQFRFGGRN